MQEEYLVHKTRDLKVYDYGNGGELVIHGPNGESIRVSTHPQGLEVTSTGNKMVVGASHVPTVIITRS